jgi:GTP-binding protein
MVDGVLLLVDAVEAADAPRPALSPARRWRWDLNRSWSSTRSIAQAHVRNGSLIQTFELFDKLGASEDQLDFPSSTLRRCGYASLDPMTQGTDMRPLFETILARIPAPGGDPDSDRCSFRSARLITPATSVVFGIGRIRRRLALAGSDGASRCKEAATRSRIDSCLGFSGLERVPVESASAGDIVLVTGVDDLSIEAPQSPRSTRPRRCR